MRYSVILLFALLFTINLNAQEIGQFTIETIAEGTRSISKTKRLSNMPEIKDTITPKQELTYQNQPAFVETSYTPVAINAAKIVVDRNKLKLDKFYVRAGFGLYTTPMLDFYFNDGANRNGTYGATMHHFSSQGGVKNSPFPGFSDNSIGLYGKYFTRKLEIGGKLDYERNAVHYYGYDTSQYDFEKADIAQHFNKISVTGYLGTFTPDSQKVNHREELTYQYTNDKFKAGEHRVIASSSVNKFVGKELYGGNIQIDYNNYTPTFVFPGCIDCLQQGEPGSTQNNFIFNLNPQVKTIGKDWNLKVGLILSGDFYDSGAKFHFYPDVEFRYSLLNDLFIPYVGVKGNTQRNNYRSFVSTNPFIIGNINLTNTINKVNIFGGIRGTISSTTSFNAQVSYLITEDMPLFVIDTLYSVANKFNVVYDDINILNLSGQLHLRQSERLKLFLRGDYFVYHVTNELAAWNLPDFRVTFSGFYDMMDKIVVRADFFVVGGRDMLTYHSLSADGNITEGENGKNILRLKPYVDLNLGVEYRYSKKISAFLNLYNIASQKYQRYLNYPAQNINVLLGFTASF